MMMKAFSMLVLCGVAAADLGYLEEKSGAGELCDKNVKQMVGYYKLHTGNKNYFYWAFESRSSPSTDPVVLWMTGGPGCSSELAMVVENGPCHVNPQGTDTFNNPYSWNNNATLIFIDQPTGTGFSYGTSYDTSEAQVAADMYDFLQQFFKAHPEYQARNFFVYGESYGGHYVPAVTHQIWKENQKPSSDKVHINLKGVSVGNGLTDPEIQYAYYPEMAASTNGHKPAVSPAEEQKMKAAVPHCQELIRQCNNGNDQDCTQAMNYCNTELMGPYQQSGMNNYDMRIKCEVPPLCYNFSNVDVWLNQPSTQKAIGVNRKWQSCNMIVNRVMASKDWMKNYQQDIPDQLAAGIRVQIYAGDQDYVCNWLGNKAWALALEWPGKAAFNAAEDKPWMMDGQEVAKIRTSGAFSFVQVHAAGHMVPMDQPKVALAMLNNFIHQ